LLQLQPEIGRYRERGLRYILITGASAETMQSVLTDLELDIMVLSDPLDKIAFDLDVRGWPTGMLFDREGNLVERTIGWTANGSLEKWKRKVDDQLEE
jgi:hypothetical protein